MATKYNCPTSPDNVSADVRIHNETAEEVGHCPHLTPISTVELENHSRPHGEKLPVPSKAEVIERNMPEWGEGPYVSPDDPLVELDCEFTCTEDDGKGKPEVAVRPKRKELLAIDAEEE